MTKFENSQISKTWEISQNNENNIKKLQKIEVRRQDVGYNKKERKIILLDDELIEEVYEWQTLVIDYTFDKLSEWAIPFIKIYHKFRTNNGFYINERLNWYSYLLWKQISDSYRLRYLLRGELYNVLVESPLSLIKAPLYCTVELIILNKFVWHEVQQKKE